MDFVTIAQTGSGKSVAGLVPNLCLHRGSLLCCDSKGELAAITARRRGQGGGGVRGAYCAVIVVLEWMTIIQGKAASMVVQQAVVTTAPSVDLVAASATASLTYEFACEHQE